MSALRSRTALPLALALLLGGSAAGCADTADQADALETPAPAPAAAPAAPDPPTSAVSPSPAPASDSLTVVFFGDSLTEGYGLAGGKAEAYPALVSARAAEAGVPLLIVNAGISGHTSADGLARIDWTLRDVTPDVFVLALGANDGLRGLSPEAMERNLRAILQRVRQKNPAARIVVVGMEALPNYGADYTGRFRAVYPRLAEAFDAERIPFLLEGVAGEERLNQRDRVHPTAEGQRIMAETVWQTLEPVLRDAAQRRAA